MCSYENETHAVSYLLLWWRYFPFIFHSSSLLIPYRIQSPYYNFLSSSPLLCFFPFREHSLLLRFPPRFYTAFSIDVVSFCALLEHRCDGAVAATAEKRRARKSNARIRRVSSARAYVVSSTGRSLRIVVDLAPLRSHSVFLPKPWGWDVKMLERNLMDGLAAILW